LAFTVNAVLVSQEAATCFKEAVPLAVPFYIFISNIKSNAVSPHPYISGALFYTHF
jgi:hypothetical protein